MKQEDISFTTCSVLCSKVKPWSLINVVQLFTGHEIFTNGPWYLHEILKKESLSMISTYVLLKSIVQ